MTSKEELKEEWAEKAGNIFQKTVEYSKLTTNIKLEVKRKQKREVVMHNNFILGTEGKKASKLLNSISGKNNF